MRTPPTTPPPPQKTGSPTNGRASPTTPSKRKEKSPTTCLLGLPLFDPRKSSFLVVWDCITLFALIYTALVTPFEVAFLEPRVGVLFVINRFVDLCFLTDLVLNFFLAYYDSEGRTWVCVHKKIAKRYLTG